jgi:hypothetical protein
MVDLVYGVEKIGGIDAENNPHKPEFYHAAPAQGLGVNKTQVSFAHQGHPHSPSL